MNGHSLLTVMQKVVRRVPFVKADVNCLNCLEYYLRDTAPLPTEESIIVREGMPIDIEQMAECRNFPERLSERFAAHERCVVGIAGGKVIGYQWFCDQPSRTEERYGYVVQIPCDAVYGYDAFVLARYRRSRVWTRFHAQYLHNLLPALGRERVIVMVDQNNTASMKAHLCLGYRLYRKVYIFMVFGKCFWIEKAIGSSGARVPSKLQLRSSDREPKGVTSFVS